jgi:hypothetical protein
MTLNYVVSASRTPYYPDESAGQAKRIRNEVPVGKATTTTNPKKKKERKKERKEKNQGKCVLRVWHAATKERPYPKPASSHHSLQTSAKSPTGAYSAAKQVCQ